MNLTNEDLLAISQLLDNKLKAELEPIKDEMRQLKEGIVKVRKEVRLANLKLENDIEPRLQNIESCYTSTHNNYTHRVSQIDSMKDDVDLLKKVVTEHSEKLT